MSCEDLLLPASFDGGAATAGRGRRGRADGAFVSRRGVCDHWGEPPCLEAHPTRIA